MKERKEKFCSRNQQEGEKRLTFLRILLIVRTKILRMKRK